MGKKVIAQIPRWPPSLYIEKKTGYAYFYLSQITKKLNKYFLEIHAKFHKNI